ncbi:flagellar motor protein MotB [Sphingomonas sp.]|uniref:OmpA/MotB family protein n=1 Tax=Sphingomonas sp. TaxID=28214 RepID=UPI0035BC7D6E
MASRGVRRSRGAEEEESYFISMADMMVGLLFVFIILLLYFALQLQEKSKALSDAGETRTQILQELKRDLAQHHLDVEIDTATGVLRLPAAILFAKGDFRLSGEGRRAVTIIAQSMADVLPCYTFPRREAGCRDTPHSVDAIFIEGHTDSDPLAGAGPISDNMDLSALRATNTFRAMEQAVSSLPQLHNRDGRPILSVSGYGADRPVPGNTGSDEAAKSRNRRIDLRFLMETPNVEGLAALLTDGAR